MREIKFRAWEYKLQNRKEVRTDNAKPVMKWVMNYEPLIYDGETCCEYDQVNLNKALANGGEAEGENKNPSIFMQFTGQLDKNGKEIYEGDIVEIKNDYGVVVSKREITYGLLADEVEGYVFSIGTGFNVNENNCSMCEAIGNIYENPELLK